MTIASTITSRRHMFAGSALAALATAILMPAAALAQTAPPAAEQAQAEDTERDIVVTGSRLISNGFSAPTPVTVVSGEQLLTTTPTTIGEGLNKLPQFANSIRPSSAQFAPESGAATQLNLRSLGAQRGLILLNGRRVNPSTASGAVDIATLPEELVKRVEIVTGGASAAYGSDAVAGVVNFILDSDFKGLKGLIQGGVTERGDNLNEKVSLTYGTPITDTLHLVASGTFYNANGVRDYRKRDWFQSCAALLNPAGPPARVQVCGAATTQMAAGGLITAGPLAGTQFLEGGVPAAFQYGTLRTGTMMLGGTGEDQGIDFQPLPSLRRATGFGQLTWKPSDTLTFFADALMAHSRAEYRGTLMQFYGSTALTIFQDNAFLPQATRQQMIDRNLQSITVGTSMPAVGFLENEGISDTQRYTAGFNAKLGEWTVDGYYEHGTNLQTIRGHGNVTIAHVFDAVDAVVNPANGQVVCRTQLADPNHACTPYNIFGPNSASQQAVDFVRNGPGGDGSWTKERTKEDVVEVVVRGHPFETWAGPFGVAFGGGYRREAVDRKVDPGSNGPKISCLQVNPNCANPYPIPRGVPSSYLARPVGAYFFSNQQPIVGGYDLWETFGEILVPLARDATLLKELDLNAAIRYTDYSLSGGGDDLEAGPQLAPDRRSALSGHALAGHPRRKPDRTLFELARRRGRRDRSDTQQCRLHGRQPGDRQYQSRPGKGRHLHHRRRVHAELRARLPVLGRLLRHRDRWSDRAARHAEYRQPVLCRRDRPVQPHRARRRWRDLPGEQRLSQHQPAQDQRAGHRGELSHGGGTGVARPARARVARVRTIHSGAGRGGGRPGRADRLVGRDPQLELQHRPELPQRAVRGEHQRADHRLGHL